MTLIGVGDGIWIPLSAPFLENSEVDNGLIYEEVLNDHSMIRNVTKTNSKTKRNY